MLRRELLGATSALAFPALGLAQAAWPDRPIKWVLSQPPGSGPDTVARLVGERLARALGQPIVVDNKPGGQNIIGAQAAAHSRADGYTFYFATTAALVSNKHLFKTLPYDPAKDFEPVAFVGRSAFAVVVNAESPITSFTDLVARAKAASGKLSLANEGPRTFGGIISRLLNARTGMGANLVAYASVGVAIQDIIGGHADVAVADLPSTVALVKQGRLRMLGVTSAKRIPGADQVPALAELVPGFEMTGWLALVAPAGTPSSAVARMSREMNTLLSDRDLAERIAASGPIVETMAGPGPLGAFLKQEDERWASVAKEIGLLPE